MMQILGSKKEVEGTKYVADGDNAADAEDAHSDARDTRLPPMRGYTPQRPEWSFTSGYKLILSSAYGSRP